MNLIKNNKNTVFEKATIDGCRFVIDLLKRKPKLEK